MPILRAWKIQFEIVYVFPGLGIRRIVNGGGVRGAGKAILKIDFVSGAVFFLLGMLLDLYNC